MYFFFLGFEEFEDEVEDVAAAAAAAGGIGGGVRVEEGGAVLANVLFFEILSLYFKVRPPSPWPRPPLSFVRPGVWRVVVDSLDDEDVLRTEGECVFWRRRDVSLS